MSVLMRKCNAFPGRVFRQCVLVLWLQGCVVVQQAPEPEETPEPVLEEVSRLYLIYLDTTGPAVSFEKPVLIDARPGQLVDAVFAADGQSIVYSHVPPAGPSDLYQYSLTEEGYRLLTQSEFADVSPFLREDARLFAVRVGPGLNREIVELSLGGDSDWSSWRAIRHPRKIIWVEDSHVVVTHGEKGARLSVYEFGTDKALELDDAVLEPVQKLPRRNWLAYRQEADDGRTWIKSLHLNTGLSRLLTPTVTGARAFFFLPDRRLFMAKGTTFYRWNRVPGDWTEIEDLASLAGDVVDVRVDPQGSAVVVTVVHREPAPIVTAVGRWSPDTNR